MRVVYHWIGLEKDINLLFFLSWVACAQTAIFYAKPCSKNAGETSIVLWITACEQRIHTSRNPNQNWAAFWRIFSSNKSALANRKTGFNANRDPNKEVGLIFAWSGSELWSLFNYSGVKLKNPKPISVDVVFKAYPMVRDHSHVDPIWPDGTFQKLF